MHMNAVRTAERGWPPAVRLVIGARFARSVGQGALVVGFTLYLSALGWNAAAIGALLSAALLFGVILTLAIGPASDRLGRRQFLLAYECVVMASAVLALVTARPWVLTLAAILGSFGRGANGAAGPFGPLEQAWLAQDLPPSETPRVFNLNSMLGFSGMAVGALIAGLPAVWNGALPGPLAYRPLFLLPLLGSAVGFALIWKAPDSRRKPRPAAPLPVSGAAPARSDERRAENRLLRRLAFANTLNGFGIGLIAPLMAYWFLRRFGHGPATIGPALAAGFVLAVVGTHVSQRIVMRLGVVRTVVVMRGVGIVLLLLTPFMPLFVLAAGVWAVRAAFNQGTIGVRQALSMGLTRQHRRGLAATVNNVSIQVPRAIGPAIAGLMLHRGWLTAPFVAAAVFQFAYLVLYERFFGDLQSVAAQAPGTVGPVRVEA
jgi:MFS family permease